MNDTQSPTDGAQPPAAGHAARREHYAKTIYEYWNPGERWEEAHPDDRTGYRADADAAMRATDRLSGGPYGPPSRADVYREVADRLSLYTEMERVKADGVGGIADKVREWAHQIADAEQPATPSPDKLLEQANQIAVVMTEHLHEMGALPDNLRLEFGWDRG
ncbi:hypothetical protein ACIQMP_07940 [Streptomyces sp. NPDC091385]|uniref:hypothetical protein n=1 Tax=Streptomyces sp. NPDC091385 TaxID=3365997 RepID=UPI0037F2ACD7